MSSLRENLDYICKLASTTYQIPIFYINSQANIVFEYENSFQLSPLYRDKKELFKDLLLKNNFNHYPLIIETPTLDSYFSIPISENGENYGCLLAGPVIFSRLNEESISGLINDLQLKIEREKLVGFYQSLPVISKLNWINMSMLLFYMLYQEKLDLVEVLQNNAQVEQAEIPAENPDVLISERLQNTLVQTNPLDERKVFESIKAGKKEEMLHYLHDFNETGQLGVLSKTSHLRSEKNLAIAAITLATRFAMDGGLYPEIAYTLSDLFIQNLEEKNDSKAVQQFIEYALGEFAERVARSKKHQYSRPISACQDYIFTHLYGEISLSKLAEKAGINPSYLSVLFKKEVGQSISAYIQRAKIEEAKNLMTFNDYSLTEIASLLNFHDQSHFTKVFKKFAGVTPKQYKRGGDFGKEEQ